MKAFLLAGVIGIMSLVTLAPSQVNAAEKQSNDTVAVRWHGHRGWYGGAHYYAPYYGYSNYYYPSYYGNYYTPSYGSYYSPGYSSYYYPTYRTYRPSVGVYVGL